MCDIHRNVRNGFSSYRFAICVCLFGSVILSKISIQKITNCSCNNLKVVWFENLEPQNVWYILLDIEYLARLIAELDRVKRSIFARMLSDRLRVRRDGREGEIFSSRWTKGNAGKSRKRMKMNDTALRCDQWSGVKNRVTDRLERNERAPYRIEILPDPTISGVNLSMRDLCRLKRENSNVLAFKAVNYFIRAQWPDL